MLGTASIEEVVTIVVSHPGTQHCVHAARGLKRAGLLECLFTSLSLRRPCWLGPTLRVLAPRAHMRLAQHRAHDDFDTDELRVFPMHLLATRMGPSWANAARSGFERTAARIALRHDAGVMAFNSSAAGTFRALEASGLPRILDQSIAHRAFRERMGREELASFPAWTSTWDGGATTPEAMAQEDEEAARADLILCGSEFCAATMVAGGVQREKLAVVEYGADTRRFTPATEDRGDAREIRLLFVGALVLRKGLPYLLEAVKRVHGLGVKVTLAGIMRVRPEALRPYEAIAEVRGPVLHAEMPNLYRTHDIYVFPSLVEGSSLSIYEALASGLPVITTPNAGSIVRDGVEGLIVAPRDVEQLAAAIEKLARDPELRRGLGAAARRRAQALGDWSHYGERLVSSILLRWPETSTRPNESPTRGQAL
jgi:glycosyltransferase involved in cell wall biosynthesis